MRGRGLALDRVNNDFRDAGFAVAGGVSVRAQRGRRNTVPVETSMGVAKSEWHTRRTSTCADVDSLQSRGRRFDSDPRLHKISSLMAFLVCLWRSTWVAPPVATR